MLTCAHSSYKFHHFDNDSLSVHMHKLLLIDLAEDIVNTVGFSAARVLERIKLIVSEENVS